MKYASELGTKNQPRALPLNLDHPRPLALMPALVRFAHGAGGETCTPRDLHPRAAAARAATTDPSRLASLRDDLSTRRGTGLVDHVPHARRYRLRPTGSTIGGVFLTRVERVSAPLPAGLLPPVAAAARLAADKRHRLDRLDPRVVTDLEALLRAGGLKTAA